MKTPEISELEEQEALPDEVQALIGEYLHYRSTDLHRLAAALQTRDFETIQSIGHNFKGTGTSFGFPQFTDAGAHLESAALRQDCESIARLASEIESAIAHHLARPIILQ